MFEEFLHLVQTKQYHKLETSKLLRYHYDDEYGIPYSIPDNQITQLVEIATERMDDKLFHYLFKLGIIRDIVRIIFVKPKGRKQTQCEEKDNAARHTILSLLTKCVQNFKRNEIQYTGRPYLYDGYYKNPIDLQYWMSLIEFADINTIFLNLTFYDSISRNRSPSWLFEATICQLSKRRDEDLMIENLLDILFRNIKLMNLNHTITSVITKLCTGTALAEWKDKEINEEKKLILTQSNTILVILNKLCELYKENSNGNSLQMLLMKNVLDIVNSINEVPFSPDFANLEFILKIKEIKFKQNTIINKIISLIEHIHPLQYCVYNKFENIMAFWIKYSNKTTLLQEIKFNEDDQFREFIVYKLFDYGKWQSEHSKILNKRLFKQLKLKQSTQLRNIKEIMESHGFYLLDLIKIINFYVGIPSLSSHSVYY